MEQNSITELLTPDSIANRVLNRRSEKQRRHGINSSIVLVEGEDDVTFFSNLIDINSAILCNAFGKPRAIQTLLILRKRNANGIVIVLDKDYDQFCGRLLDDPDILYLDTHDVETLLLSSNAIRKFLLSLLPSDKLFYAENFLKETLTLLTTNGVFIGKVRIIFEMENINIDFSNTNFFHISKSTGRINEEEYITEIISKNGDCPLSKTEIYEKISELNLEGENAWMICHGHDTIYILQKIIPITLNGLLNTSEIEILKKNELINCAKITHSLILSYESSDFLRTKIYQGINSWERRNPPFVILDRKPITFK